VHFNLCVLCGKSILTAKNAKVFAKHAKIIRTQNQNRSPAPFWPDLLWPRTVLAYTLIHLGFTTDYVPSYMLGIVDSGHLRLALLSTAVLGFRHGLDYDHIAAITDISSVQAKASDAMRYGLLYVAGHATMVALLGAAVVAFRIPLPAGTDRWAERAVGLTLLVLGAYVLGTFFRESPTHTHAHPRTRITLMINGALWIYWRLTRIFGGTRVEAPQIFKDGYGTASAFVVGVVHGFGAETPTQLGLFFMAASLGGTGAGLLGLLMFIVGLILMNTLMCASAAGLFSATLAKPSALRGLTLLTSVYSIVVGAIFLAGAADRLPSLTG
jgi:high-affinity nickel permease